MVVQSCWIAEWVMGNDPNKTGTNSQVVDVAVVGSEGIDEFTTKFTATNLKPGPIDNTSVTGIVLDNSNQPLPDVEVNLSGDHFATIRTTTDAEGRFEFLQAPVGTVHLGFDGGTTTSTGEYPKLMYELVTVSGQENTVGMPVYIPTLNVDGGKVAGGNQEVIIPMKGVEGAEVIIAPNSVTFPDGRTDGRIMFSQVQTDKVPMPAPNGSVFDVAWTLQPSGTHFDPPARISLPNANGGKPGEEQEMFSFDHDLMEWISIGPGVVSDDGSRIISREGFGVRHAGWGGAPPPPPPPTCNINCNDSDECTSDSKKDCLCINKLIPDKISPNQTPNNCQTELCSGSRVNDGDTPVDSTGVGDCKISGCLAGSATPVEDDTDKPRPQDNPDNFCKTCKQGNIEPDTDRDNQQLPNDECKVCKNGVSVDVKVDVSPLIPDGNKYCVGESVPVTVTTVPPNLAVSLTSKKGNLTVSGGSTAFTLNAIKAGRDEDLLESKYLSCSADSYGILVVPKSVNDLWNFPLLGDPDPSLVEEAIAYKDAHCSLNNQQNISINHSIDGCSGPSPQKLKEQGNTMINLVASGVVFDLFTGPEPIWGQARSPNPPFGSSDPLACNTHDICYQTCGSTQDTCDRGLQQNIISSCNLAYPTSCPYLDGTAVGNAKCVEYDEERAACEKIADAFYAGLNLFGKTAHDNRQVQYCDCCQP